MKHGTLYGIGVGPGDPELIAVKGAHILAHCSHIFVPKARTATESVALAIAGRYVSKDAEVTELLFPMETDQRELSRRWGRRPGPSSPSLKAAKMLFFSPWGIRFFTRPISISSGKCGPGSLRWKL